MKKNKFVKLKDYLRTSYLYLGFGLIIIFILLLFYFRLNLEPAEPRRPITTEVHYADNITEAHLKLIEKFNKKYAGRIKVIPINLPFSKFSTNERKELIARALRSKSEKIDVFASDIIWGHRFSKWAENLSPYFGGKYAENFITEIMPTCYYKDTLIALPLKIDLGTMYYQDKLLNEIDKTGKLEKRLAESITWEEFINLGIRLKKNKKPFYLFPAADYEGLICSYVEMILNQDRDFFANENFDFSRNESVKALNLMVDLIHKHRLTPEFVTSVTEYPCHEYFINNNGIFLRSWPTFIHDYNMVFRKNNPDLSVKRAPLPHFKGSVPAAVFGGWNLIISKFSEHKKEAAEFIRFLHERESQLLLFGENGSLPVLSSLYEDEEESYYNETLKYYKDQFRFGVHRPLTEDYTRISDIVTYYVHKALKKELTPKEALERASRSIKTGMANLN